MCLTIKYLCVFCWGKDRVMEIITVCYLYTFNKVRKSLNPVASNELIWNPVCSCAGLSVSFTNKQSEFTAESTLMVIYLSTQWN